MRNTVDKKNFKNKSKKDQGNSKPKRGGYEKKLEKHTFENKTDRDSNEKGFKIKYDPIPRSFDGKFNNKRFKENNSSTDIAKKNQNINKSDNFTYKKFNDQKFYEKNLDNKSSKSKFSTDKLLKDKKSTDKPLKEDKTRNNPYKVFYTKANINSEMIKYLESPDSNKLKYMIIFIFKFYSTEPKEILAKIKVFNSNKEKNTIESLCTSEAKFTYQLEVEVLFNIFLIYGLEMSYSTEENFYLKLSENLFSILKVECPAIKSVSDFFFRATFENSESINVYKYFIEEISGKIVELLHKEDEFVEYLKDYFDLEKSEDLEKALQKFSEDISDNSKVDDSIKDDVNSKDDFFNFKPIVKKEIIQNELKFDEGIDLISLSDSKEIERLDRELGKMFSGVIAEEDLILINNLFRALELISINNPEKESLLFGLKYFVYFMQFDRFDVLVKTLIRKYIHANKHNSRGLFRSYLRGCMLIPEALKIATQFIINCGDDFDSTEFYKIVLLCNDEEKLTVDSIHFYECYGSIDNHGDSHPLFDQYLMTLLDKEMVFDNVNFIIPKIKNEEIKGFAQMKLDGIISKRNKKEKSLLRKQNKRVKLNKEMNDELDESNSIVEELIESYVESDKNVIKVDFAVEANIVESKVKADVLKENIVDSKSDTGVLKENPAFDSKKKFSVKPKANVKSKPNIRSKAVPMSKNDLKEEMVSQAEVTPELELKDADISESKVKAKLKNNSKVPFQPKSEVTLKEDNQALDSKKIKRASSKFKVEESKAESNSKAEIKSKEDNQAPEIKPTKRASTKSKAESNPKEEVKSKEDNQSPEIKPTKRASAKPKEDNKTPEIKSIKKAPTKSKEEEKLEEIQNPDVKVKKRALTKSKREVKSKEDNQALKPKKITKVAAKSKEEEKLEEIQISEVQPKNRASAKAEVKPKIDKPAQEILHEDISKDEVKPIKDISKDEVNPKKKVIKQATSETSLKSSKSQNDYSKINKKKFTKKKK